MKTAGEYILEKIKISENLDEWNDIYENAKYLLNEMAKWMTDYRQHDVGMPTDEEIQIWAAEKVNEIDPDEWGYGDLLIEGANWCKSQIKQ